MTYMRGGGEDVIASNKDVAAWYIYMHTGRTEEAD